MEREHVAADVVFIDPPYRMKDAYSETLRALADSPVVWAMSMVIAEHEKKFDPGEGVRVAAKIPQTGTGQRRAEFLPHGEHGRSAKVKVRALNRGAAYMISSSARRAMGCCISSRSFFTMFRP